MTQSRWWARHRPLVAREECGYQLRKGDGQTVGVGVGVGESLAGTAWFCFSATSSKKWTMK